MPTPKEWIANLERLQQINGYREPEPPKVEAEEPDLKTALTEIENAMGDAADKLLAELPNIPEEHRREFLTGFLTGLVIYITGSIAYAQQDQ